MACLGRGLAQRFLLVSKGSFDLRCYLKTHGMQCWIAHGCRHHSRYEPVAIDLGMAGTFALPGRLFDSLPRHSTFHVSIPFSRAHSCVLA